MGRRVLPALLALLAAVADAGDAHALARAAILFAVPFAAVGALTAFGEWLEVEAAGTAGFHALAGSFAVALLVLSCAVRSASGGVPAIASSTLLAALALYAAKGVVGAGPYVRRLPVRAAKP